MPCLRYSFVFFSSFLAFYDCAKCFLAQKVCTCLEFLRHCPWNRLLKQKHTNWGKQGHSIGRRRGDLWMRLGSTYVFSIWFPQCVTHVSSCNALQSCTILSFFCLLSIWTAPRLLPWTRPSPQSHQVLAKVSGAPLCWLASTRNVCLADVFLSPLPLSPFHTPHTTRLQASTRAYTNWLFTVVLSCSNYS